VIRKLLAISLWALAGAALARAPAAVDVTQAWARAVLPGQASSGGYMVLTAREPLKLVGATSPAAAIIEIHQMKMEGDVMKMRAVDTLDLSVGKPVEFKPGGYHFMLMDLQSPFKAGTQVPLTLQFKDAKGAARQLQVSLPVALTPPTAGKR
jgi:copper(I)-binding protein